MIQPGSATSPYGRAGRQPVLYAVACGSPVARYLGRLVALAQAAGWQVCAVSTPDGRKFMDVPALYDQTGHPVRSEFKNPSDPDLLPCPDAIVVAPATVNTVNKWASGIADTLALGLLVEAYGLGLPIVVMPYTNTAMAAHPAFQDNLRRLRSWGVRVLFGDEVMAMPPPGGGAMYAVEFPWHLALAALGPARPARLNPQPYPATRLPSQSRLAPPRGSRPGLAAPRLSPPAAPRPAPAIGRPPAGVAERSPWSSGRNVEDHRPPAGVAERSPRSSGRNVEDHRTLADRQVNGGT